MLTVLIPVVALAVVAGAFAVAAVVARNDLTRQIGDLRVDLETCRRIIDALSEAVGESRAASYVPSEADAKAIEALHVRLQQLLSEVPSPPAFLDGADITDEELEALFAK